MIAFLGMGLLGGNFVRALRERGEAVQIYNRSPEKARALEETGALVLPDPASAARGAKHLHLTLSDDASVDAVLELARPGLSSDVHIVDHTTTSPEGTRERAARWAQRGIAYTHAPVFMSPANARGLRVDADLGRALALRSARTRVVQDDRPADVPGRRA